MSVPSLPAQTPGHERHVPVFGIVLPVGLALLSIWACYTTPGDFFIGWGQIFGLQILPILGLRDVFVIFALGLLLLGGVVALRGGPVPNPRDYYGGLVLIALALLAIWASRELPGQRGFAFGPGTAPRLFSLILAGLAAAVAVVGVTTEGERIEKYKIRGPLLVIISILLFAALIRPFGLVVATFLAFIVSIMGSSEMRWIESLIAAALMTLGCVLLFVTLLNLPFQLWPADNAATILYRQFEDIFKNAVLMFQNAPPPGRP